MAHPLEVIADLRLAVDGDPIDVRGDGECIVVDLPSLRVGRRLLTPGLFGGGNRRTRLAQLGEALDSRGLTLDVRLQRELVARVGAAARPGALARRLRMGAVEVHPAGPLKQRARRRPLLTAILVTGAIGLVAWLLARNGTDSSGAF